MVANEREELWYTMRCFQMKINTINGNDASETLIHKNTSRQAQKAQKHMGDKHHIRMAQKIMQLALS